MAGESQTCAIRTAGDVSCWGGSTGDGSGQNALVPTTVSGIGDATDLAAGYAHTCAVRANHTVSCWGYGTDGQLGGGTQGGIALAPVAVPGVTDAVAIAAGLRHTCALRGGGTVKCWGGNAAGQLGGGNGGGVTRVVALGAGEDSTCAVRHSGELRCWGRDAQLTPAIGDATAVDGGSRHACALRSGGSVICWGRNVAGQLGIGTTDGAGFVHRRARHRGRGRGRSR